MASNYSCLILDVDGTLLDYTEAERAAIAGTLTAFELPCTEEAFAKYSEINEMLWKQLERNEIKKDTLAKQRFALLLEFLQQKKDPIRMNNDFMTRLSQEAQMIPGADELLSELAEFCTLIALSNSGHRSLLSRLEKSGLLPYFDGVYSSEKMGVAKPHSKCFTYPLKQLGITNTKRVLVAGDSLTADIKGGAACGLDTCWCNFQNEENTTNIQPTHTARNFAELKLIAIGEKELKLAETREKRHLV